MQGRVRLLRTLSRHSDRRESVQNGDSASLSYKTLLRKSRNTIKQPQNYLELSTLFTTTDTTWNCLNKGIWFSIQFTSCWDKAKLISNRNPARKQSCQPYLESLIVIRVVGNAMLPLLPLLSWDLPRVIFVIQGEAKREPSIRLEIVIFSLFNPQ